MSADAGSPEEPRPNAIQARFCYGCRKGGTPRTGGVWAFEGGYWHRMCFAKASPEKRLKARIKETL